MMALSRRFPLYIIAILTLLAAFCGPLISQALAKENRPEPLEYYSFGDVSAPTTGKVSAGLLLMGGGDRNIDAMKWFFAKAGGGHIVVLSASYGREIGEEFMGVGGIASTDIYVFHSRKQSYDAAMLAKLARADGIFIAGGDQARYVRYWRGTPVARALDAHVASGKPLGGTSAGLAMLGEKLYGAMDGGSLKSKEALADPFGKAVTIEGNFLHLPLLKGIITDSHFKERNRLGRLFAMLAKAQKGLPKTRAPMIGLGVDENAALAVEGEGRGQIYTSDGGGMVWLVNGAALRNVPTKGPLEATGIEVTIADKNSVVHLPSGKVEGGSILHWKARTGEIALDENVPIF